MNHLMLDEKAMDALLSQLQAAGFVGTADSLQSLLSENAKLTAVREFLATAAKVRDFVAKAKMPEQDKRQSLSKLDECLAMVEKEAAQYTGGGMHGHDVWDELVLTLERQTPEYSSLTIMLQNRTYSGGVIRISIWSSVMIDGHRKGKQELAYRLVPAFIDESSKEDSE